MECGNRLRVGVLVLRTLACRDLRVGPSKFESPQMWVWPQAPLGGTSPSPPLALADPSLKLQPFPPSTPPPCSPHPPWLFLRCSGIGRHGLAWGRGPRAQSSGGGVPSKRHLGPAPHLGVLDKLRRLGFQGCGSTSTFLEHAAMQAFTCP